MDQPAPPPDSQLKSLTKVVRILDCFSTTDRTQSVNDIARRTRLPKSTAHRLLASMRAVGLLEQTGERDHYRLGLKLFELGNTVLANMDLHREARPFVDTLTRLSGQSVHLAVFDGRHAVVVQRADPAPEKAAPPGFIETAPAHCTSVGKAILAWQDAETIARLTAGGLPRFTDATITDPAALQRELETIRARGYAIDEGEHQPGLRCVGAPVRDRSGRVFAAISASGPAWRLAAAEIPDLAKIVRHNAEAISLCLGYRG